MRQECELLAGLFSIVGEADKERKQTFENLELECTKLQKKVCLLDINSMHLVVIGGETVCLLYAGDAFLPSDASLCECNLI